VFRFDEASLASWAMSCSVYDTERLIERAQRLRRAWRIGVAGRQTDEQFDAQICARADFHGFISRVPAPTGSSKFDSETKLIALHALVKDSFETLLSYSDRETGNERTSDS
jgi:hypothetical protein